MTKAHRPALASLHLMPCACCLFAHVCVRMPCTSEAPSAWEKFVVFVLLPDEFQVCHFPSCRATISVSSNAARAIAFPPTGSRLQAVRCGHKPGSSMLRHAKRPVSRIRWTRCHWCLNQARAFPTSSFLFAKDAQPSGARGPIHRRTGVAPARLHVVL